VAAPNAYPAMRDGLPFWKLVLVGLWMRLLVRTLLVSAPGSLLYSRAVGPGSTVD
jgi:hypothetical protein